MKKMNWTCVCVIALASVLLPTSQSHRLFGQAEFPKTLPTTRPLDWDGDIASRLVEGVDQFLLRKLDESVAQRATHWKRDTSSATAYSDSIEVNRRRLAYILGARDPRPGDVRMEIVDAVGDGPGWIVSTGQFNAYPVRWRAFADVDVSGILIEPKGEVTANVVAILDADQVPEEQVALMAERQGGWLSQLATRGCRVVVPRLVSRRMQKRRGAELTDREFLYRSAFELGRHLIGYEVQQVLSAADWFEQQDDEAKTIVIGYGEGGMIALYASALDTRIDATCVSGYFAPREGIWNQPIDRNVFGLLEQFGDAELAAMVAPRPFIVAASPGPAVTLPGRGGAPAELRSPKLADVQSEFERAKKLAEGLDWDAKLIADSDDPLVNGAIPALLGSVGADNEHSDLTKPTKVDVAAPRVDPAAAQEELIRQLDQHNQRLLVDSPYVRKQFMEKLNVSSVEAHANTVESYRDYFRDQVVGSFDDELLTANPRSRKAYDHGKWTGYEVVLDVFPDVIAFGVLLIPKDVAQGERRPVVVCQHGLEGRPRDTIEGDAAAYHDFSAKLAERGFVVFAPQNLYIFRDRFRTLQRKANPLGKTLFSIMVPQHQQIADWLATLPFVDPERIGFYGLSYGGKSAMRIPPLVDRYCLSVCSADFNDWVWKNASTRSPYSYVWTGEYEIFEFDLGGTFNYSEMAALIAPRPFMVERGHFDGVAPDERVALEFAKVRHLYQAKLGIGDRCEIEWFVGPHTINGKGTYDFLHKHLKWPKLK